MFASWHLKLCKSSHRGQHLWLSVCVPRSVRGQRRSDDTQWSHRGSWSSSGTRLHNTTVTGLTLDRDIKCSHIKVLIKSYYYINKLCSLLTLLSDLNDLFTYAVDCSYGFSVLIRCCLPVSVSEHHFQEDQIWLSLFPQRQVWCTVPLSKYYTQSK